MRGVVLAAALVVAAAGVAIHGDEKKKADGPICPEDTMVPCVESIYPRSGLMLGETLITIKGVNLAMVATCKFGDKQSPVLYAELDGSQVQCKTPTATMPIPVPVTISESAGGAADFIPISPNKDGSTTYQYYELPRILGIYPKNGPAFGDTQVALQVDKTFLSGHPPESACMFGDKITPVVNHRCLADYCYVYCVTPQVCAQVDPEKKKCKTTKVTVQVSLNGQDFSTDPKEDISFTYENAWTYESRFKDAKTAFADEKMLTEGPETKTGIMYDGSGQ